MTGRTAPWQRANERWLQHRIAEVTARLSGDDPGELAAAAGAVREKMKEPPALEALAEAVGMTDFEQSLLLLCAGVELRPDTAAVVGALLGHDHETAPTLALALDRLAGSHWSAVSPGRPLRGLRMIEAGPGGLLATSPLRIDERVLHHLVGADYLDERLASLVAEVVAPDALAPSHRRVAARIADALESDVSFPQVVGPHRTDRLAVAVAASGLAGLRCYRIDAVDIPSSATEREGLQRLWVREMAFAPSLLVVEVGDRATAETEASAARFAERTMGAMVSAREAIDVEGPSRQFDVAVVPLGERWEIIAHAGGFDAATTPPAAVAQFELDTARLVAAGAEAGRSTNGNGIGPAIWTACRAQARPRLELLAQRIEPRATWEDLVVPDHVVAILREIRSHVRYQAEVYDDWGFRNQSSRGLGITALFSGASGTGKTMAAEVLANDLELDLFRIDLASVVSKYIGETEKNLRQVFDAADDGGAILLFDEADALFGKRTEVKDSHDRYANIEVSYLLQRMEAFRGLAILTTNLRDALDEAFLRRIRFVVRFPFPDTADRERLWRSIWPAGVPVGDLDFDRLAALTLPGGNIRSIAIDASFRAAAVADSGAEPEVDMALVAGAVRAEAAKVDLPLPARDWGEQP